MCVSRHVGTLGAQDKPPRPHQSLVTSAGLTKLDMRWTGHATESEVTDRGLGHLHTLRSLKHLNLAGHRGLTSEGVAFLSHLTDLTSLCLAGKSKLVSS